MQILSNPILIFDGPTPFAPAISSLSFTGATISAFPGGAQVSVTGGSGGTVTSVGLSMPAIFSVSGSPVVGAGVLTATLNTQSANTIFAGPTSGGAAIPTFRTLVAADLTSALPSQGGNAGKFLQTDGAGTLSWQSAGGGGGGVNPSTTNNLAYYDSGTTVGGLNNMFIAPNNAGVNPAIFLRRKTAGTETYTSAYSSFHAGDQTGGTVTIVSTQSFVSYNLTAGTLSLAGASLFYSGSVNTSSGSTVGANAPRSFVSQEISGSAAIYVPATRSFISGVAAGSSTQGGASPAHHYSSVAMSDSAGSSQINFGAAGYSYLSFLGLRTTDTAQINLSGAGSFNGSYVNVIAFSGGIYNFTGTFNYSSLKGSLAFGTVNMGNISASDISHAGLNAPGDVVTLSTIVRSRIIFVSLSQDMAIKNIELSDIRLNTPFSPVFPTAGRVYINNTGSNASIGLDVTVDGANSLPGTSEQVIINQGAATTKTPSNSTYKGGFNNWSTNGGMIGRVRTAASYGDGNLISYDYSNAALGREQWPGFLFGTGLITRAPFEFVIGRWNTDISYADPIVIDGTLPAFRIGGGTSGVTRADVLRIDQDGKVRTYAAERHQTRVAVASPVTVSARTDYSIGLNTGGAATVNLPTLEDGLEYLITSLDGAGAITLNGGGANIIYGGASLASHIIVPGLGGTIKVFAVGGVWIAKYLA